MNSQSQQPDQTQPETALPCNQDERYANALEFALWLDSELENLENQHSDFVTKRSTAKSFGR